MFFERIKSMYEYRAPYIIDFTNVKYYLQVHEIIKEALDFPDYYGKNWDAFWDCLTDMVGRQTNIEIYGFDTLQQKFSEDANLFIEIIKEFKHYRNDKYAHEITIRIIDGNTEQII